MDTTDPIDDLSPADAWRELRQRRHAIETVTLGAEAGILRRALVAGGWRWGPAAALLGIAIGTLRRALTRHPGLAAARLAHLAEYPDAHTGTRSMRKGLRTQASQEEQGLAPESAKDLADQHAYPDAHAAREAADGAAK